MLLVPGWTGYSKREDEEYCKTVPRVAMDDEDLKELGTALKDIRYPKGMICPIYTEIAGRGYYPAFKGFENGPDPRDGIMFLNRDFGGIDYYTELSSESQRRGCPVKEKMHTWNQTEDLYLPGLSNIPVWLTNYLMGVRDRELMEVIKKASKKNVKATTNVKTWIPELEWTAYESYCWAFFLRQVNKQRPRVVAVFGRYNREDLFRDGRLGHRTTAEKEFEYTFKFNDCEPHRCWIIHDRHPSSVAKGEKSKSRIRNGILKRIRELHSVFESALQMPQI